MKAYLLKKFPVLLLFVSVFITFILVVSQYFPYIGLALSFTSISALSLLPKKRLERIDIVYFVLSLIFSFFLVLRSNAFLTFLNVLATIYAICLLSITNNERKSLTFTKLVGLPLFLLLQLFRTRNNYPITSIFSNNKPARLTVSNGVSFALTVLLLLIIIPLLSSANPLFANLIQQAINFLKLETVIDFLLSDLVIPRIILFIALLFILPKFYSLIFQAQETWAIEIPKPHFQFTLPKFAVALVVLIFFITQTQLYFSDIETLRLLELTYSEYAREVFGQLIVVSGIIIALLYNESSRTKIGKVLTGILLIEVLFLSIMAFKSVFDYSNQWGFTEKRLWGFTGVFWMLLVLGAYAYTYIADIKTKKFVGLVAYISVLTLIFVNIINFDWMVFNFRKSTTENGVDYFYLLSLSSDARAYKSILNIYTNNLEDRLIMGTNEYAIVDYTLWQIEGLQNKYKNMDIRSYNISEYLQYNDFKNVNVAELREKWLENPIYASPDEVKLPVN